MIIEIELALIAVLIAPWRQMNSARLRWIENRKLALEHVEAQRLKLAIEREANHEERA